MKTESSVARDTDQLINTLTQLGRNAPDVAALVSLVVGFPCDIAELDEDGGASYQVMTDHARDFWDWHLDANEQFHATPARAAAHFVQQYHYWLRHVSGGPPAR